MKNYKAQRASKPNHSDRYQHKFNEISVDPVQMDDFDISRGLGQHVIKSAISNEFYDLQEKLIVAVKRIIDTQLTKHQATVIYMILDGYTQQEIADHIGICQTSVFKSLYGNQIYCEGPRNGMFHGGSYKRLKALCSEDAEIIEILERMEEVRGMTPFDYY